jgi:TonB family protein
MRTRLLLPLALLPGAALADPPQDTSPIAATAQPQPDKPGIQPSSTTPLARPFPDGMTPPNAIGRHGPCRKDLIPRPLYGVTLGPTTVSFTVTVEGTVQDAAVEHSSGSDALDRGALSCVATWLYRPASWRNGTPQAVHWLANVDWKQR